MNFIRAEIFQQNSRFAGYFQTRYALRIVQDLHILPRQFPAPAGFEGFQKRFFSGKTRGEALRRSRAFAVAVSAFFFRKNAACKTRRSFQSFADAVNFYNVYADGNYHQSKVRTVCDRGRV